MVQTLLNIPHAIHGFTRNRSGISGKLKHVDDYQNVKYIEGNSVRSEMLQQVLLGNGQSLLACVDKFSYLGDMTAAGGGAEEVSKARLRCTWAKFRELAPILTSRGASFIVKGKVYKACAGIW